MTAATMRRALLALFLIALPCQAESGNYSDLIHQAASFLEHYSQGDTEGIWLDRATEKLGDATKVDPTRWEAWFYLGIVNCQKAVWAQSLWEQKYFYLKAQGVPPAKLREYGRKAREFRDGQVQEAYQDFARMKHRMAALGIDDPVRIQFANACMKYGGREFLHAKNNRPGAIEDFKALVAKGFLPEWCAYCISRCYLEVGRDSYDAKDYQNAVRLWKLGLNWARNRTIRRVLLTNIAGAYQMDNSYGSAEKVLREQIRDEPGRPEPWENLGLVLGYEGHVREALHDYAKARELCGRPVPGRFFPGILHGNAWLRAANIHAQLLEQDGDLLLAWRLFLQYRAMLGDDYNFSLAFGDLALYFQQFDLARTYYEHARKLQPLCPVPYQKLMEIAVRLPGDAAARKRRIEDAKRAYNKVRELSVMQEQLPEMQRLCGGLRELAEGAPPGPPSYLDPDPLKGFDADHPPEWLKKAAKARKPFVPWKEGDVEVPVTPAGAPGGSAPQADPAKSADPAKKASRWSSPILLGIAAAVAAFFAAGVLLARRRRAQNS